MLTFIQQILTMLATGSGIYVAINGLNSWKRETIGKRDIELCQKVIELFYEAEHRLEILRSPLSYAEEGNSRPKPERESEHDQDRRNVLYVPLARFHAQSEFWSEFFSYKFRMRAIFGENAVEAFNSVDEALRAFRAAALTRYQALANNPNSLNHETTRKFEEIIWSGSTNPDELDQKMKRGISMMEEICVPIVRASRDGNTGGIFRKFRKIRYFQ